MRIRISKKFRITSTYILATVSVILVLRAILLDREDSQRDDAVDVAQTGISLKGGLNTERIHKNDDINSLRGRCQDWFSDFREENLRVISNYPVGAAKNYFPFIGGDAISPKGRVGGFPVIVTAADFKYTKLLGDLLDSVNIFIIPKYNLTKVIVYDLGMYPHHIIRVKNSCTICEVRAFSFEKFPNHVNRWNLKNYSWKPLLIRTTLLEFGWVFFVDASIRFITDELDKALQYSVDNSILFYTAGDSLSITRQTDTRTFDYLKEDNCKYRKLGELSSGFVLFHYDDVTRVIVDAWASCALNEQCITPNGTEDKLFCSMKNKTVTSDDAAGTCHRFDQSALGIIVRRLYHEHKYYPIGDESLDIYTVERVAAFELQDEDMFYYNRDKQRKAVFERRQHNLIRKAVILTSTIVK